MADRLLTSTADVEAFCALVRAHGTVALDTEFVWERTYAPQLCLVQLAAGSNVVLVDPLAGAGLEPVAGLVADPAVEVIMHAPNADLLAFGLLYETRPTRILDTQLVAGFVGLTANASLERLLQDALRIRLAHHESFSDWRRRPLSDVQVAYAGDDVRHLEPLAAQLHDRLGAAGRQGWASDELALRYPDGADPTPQPQEAWRKVARRGRLSPRQLAHLRAVTAWREREARRRDLPAGWIIKDPTLVEIARVGPESEEALRRIRGVGTALRGADVEALLAAVREGAAAEPITAPAGPPPAAQRRADAASGLAAAVLRVRCQEAGVAPELVATRGELDRFVEGVVVGDASEQPLGQGWRRDLVGDELVALVEGRLALSLNQRAPYLVVKQLGSAAPTSATSGPDV